MELRIITPELLPAFVPYLLPEAAQALQEQRNGLYGLGAVSEDWHTCGAVCGRVEDGTLILNSLLVDPAVRRQGVAAALLDGLERETGLTVGEAHWFLPEEDAPAVTALLTGRGLSVSTEERGIMELDCAAMAQHSACRRAFLPGFRPDPNIIPVTEITPEERSELLADPEIPAALRLDQFTPEQLASPLNVAYRYRGTIAAYFLAQPTPDGASVLAAVSRSTAHGGAFFQLASAAIHQSLPYLPAGGGRYWLEAVNETSDKLARFLCRDKFRTWHMGHAYRQG